MNYLTVASGYLSRLMLLAETNDIIENLKVVPEGALDKLLYGLKITLIGMSTVFLVLIILMCVIKLFGLFFYTIPNRKKEEQKAAPAETPAAAPAVTQTVAVSDEDETEIAAVIAAAVAVYCEQNGVQGKYRIKSFKRVN